MPESLMLQVLSTLHTLFHLMCTTTLRDFLHFTGEETKLKRSRDRGHGRDPHCSTWCQSVFLPFLLGWARSTHDRSISYLIEILFILSFPVSLNKSIHQWCYTRDPHSGLQETKEFVGSNLHLISELPLQHPWHGSFCLCLKTSNAGEHSLLWRKQPIPFSGSFTTCLVEGCPPGIAVHSS